MIWIILIGWFEASLMFGIFVACRAVVSEKRESANERRLLLRANSADTEAAKELAFQRAMADTCAEPPRLKIAEDG